MTLLEIDDLRVSFRTEHGRADVLHGVSLTVARGEVLALLGESGSGKSVTAAAVMDLLPKGTGRIAGGAVRFDGTDLLVLPPEKRRAVCGSRIALVFQDALAALNPVQTVGAQIAEMFRIHNRPLLPGRVVDLMARVGIPDPARRAQDYPHQFSGGMRQRVAIAMALALDPDLVIADEPTTALDVTVQAQILDLIRSLRDETGAAVIFITHDLGVVAEIADRVAVMYAGRIVEVAAVADLFERPSHPYSAGLLASQPRLGQVPGAALAAIPGTAPDPSRLPPGCAFAPRCALADDLCRTTRPDLRRLGTHDVACHHPKGAA